MNMMFAFEADEWWWRQHRRDEICVEKQAGQTGTSDRLRRSVNQSHHTTHH